MGGRRAELSDTSWTQLEDVFFLCRLQPAKVFFRRWEEALFGAWPGTVDSRGPPFPGLFGGSYGAAGRAPNAAWELLGSWGELTSRTEFHLFRQLKPMRLSNLS